MNPCTPEFTDDMAAQAAAVFFGHPQPGSANAFRDALNAFAPLVAAKERKRCSDIVNSQYGAIDADPDDYIGKEQHSDSWKMACTTIGMLINSND